MSTRRWKLQFEVLDDFLAAEWLCEEEQIPVFVRNHVRLLLAVGDLSESQAARLRKLRAAISEDVRIGQPE